MTISTAGSVQQERMCKPEASNAEQGEKVCHQGWRFTLHSQGMDAYTELLSEEGKAAIPTDPDSPASPELLPSYRDRQVFGLVPHGVCRT